MSMLSLFQRRKRLLLPLLIGVPLLAMAAILIWCMDGGTPLTASDAAKKQRWSDRELGETIGRSMTMTGSAEDKAAMRKNLMEQMSKRTPEQQKTIRRQAFHAALDSAIEQFRAVPRDKRRAAIKTLSDTMKKGIASGHRPPSGARPPHHSSSSSSSSSSASAQMPDQAEMEAAQQEIVTAYNNKLTSDERADLAPVMEIVIRAVQQFQLPPR